MNGTTLRTGVLILLVLAAIVLYSSVFIVQQTQYALVLRFGAVQSAISEPGLKFKLPLVDAVTYFEKRVLDLDLPVQTILSADRQNLEVDAFTRYRIIDPLRFYQAVGNIALANQRLQSFTNSAMRNILASASRDAIVRTERADLMNRIQDRREPAGRKPRHRDDRRAPHPRRSAGGQQPGRLPAHAHRA